MDSAINNLYSTFANYRIDDDFIGCDCCVAPEHSTKLTAPPLRDLTFEDLEHYSRKAMTTWGEINHFKHFLPRLFELTIKHRDDFLDLSVVFGKLSYAKLDQWPQCEQDAVHHFITKYWDYQLSEPIVCDYESSIDDVLCAISNALSSVEPFLERWIDTPTDNAKWHLAAFILNNNDSLISNGILANEFWNTSGLPHRQVINWLKSYALLSYFNDANKKDPDSNSSIALSQLLALRSTLAG